MSHDNRYEQDEDVDYLDPEEIERSCGMMREARLALASLKLGESITCPAGREWHALRVAASAAGYYSHKRFTTRKIDSGTYRVWRTR